MTAEPLVSLRNVVKRFKDGAGETTILDGVDLAVMPGELVVLLGSSGSGKSTLLHLMGALDVEYQGTVHVLGKELKALKDRERAGLRSEKIGFVFQAYHLHGELTALENVLLAAMFSSKAPDRKWAEQLLNQVGLTKQKDREARHLSGGEKQRVALARALYHNPPIILCDEPTGNLDQDNASEVLRLLSSMRLEKTCIVVVTHDERLAQQADHVWKLVGGRLC
ncbi:MAG: ABC transporter ATP-binding protein [Deltaproteobacteria bacterium]|jgi:putative ABC transport system ATP-binding protein|nr:ABC transporter ATP-binding protein [Deltaproteobacteria bacterium]MBT6432035.1 ABC transporter ATP-binding protein [Deltaproteobacteria bacterium]MBT6488298.1 ABC transporter ATP-binding protein [Deltaproteobacteria bacterium]